MNQDIWRPRLVAAIALAYRQCWEEEDWEDIVAEFFRISQTPLESQDESLTESDLRVIAMADLILPLATAGFLDEHEKVSDLPSPATIRNSVLKLGLQTRCMSIGCQLADAAREEDSAFSREVAREWSTWISYCMRAHSPDLRAALSHLPEAVVAISEFGHRPRRRIERLGPDGERLISVVPSGPNADKDDEWIEPLLDHCETVAAHADSFRAIGDVFPELFNLVAGYESYDQRAFGLELPFSPFLWPFSIDSARHVVEITGKIRQLARNLARDDDGDGMKMGEESYALKPKTPDSFGQSSS